MMVPAYWQLTHRGPFYEDEQEAIAHCKLLHCGVIRRVSTKEREFRALKSSKETVRRRDRFATLGKVLSPYWREGIEDHKLAMPRLNAGRIIVCVNQKAWIYSGHGIVHHSILLLSMFFETMIGDSDALHERRTEKTKKRRRGTPDVVDK